MAEKAAPAGLARPVSVGARAPGVAGLGGFYSYLLEFVRFLVGVFTQQTQCG